MIQMWRASERFGRDKCASRERDLISGIMKKKKGKEK